MAYGEKMSRLSPCSDEYVAGLVNDTVPHFKSLLDVGCGRGERLAFLAEAFPSSAFFGLDIDHNNLLTAQMLCPAANTVMADAASLPFEPESFDVLLCECSFSLFELPEQCAAEMFRVLRPEGTLILSDIYAGLPEKATQVSCGCGTVKGLYPQSFFQRTLTEAGFSLNSYIDRSRDLKSMTAQMIWDGTLSSCMDCDTIRLMRAAKAGYGVWIFHR